jgi:hypothetical protein
MSKNHHDDEVKKFGYEDPNGSLSEMKEEVEEGKVAHVKLRRNQS